jgi:6-phosphogluconolactonase
MKTTVRSAAWFLAVLAPFLAARTSIPESKGTPQSMDAEQYIAYVGTYTTKTKSEGIYAFRYDAASGKLRPMGVAAKTGDPSFLAVHPDGKHVYAVNEAGKASTVSAFSRNADGTLTLLNQVPALGEDPCFLSFDRTGKYVLVANYTSGNVAVFPIMADGKLGAATSNLRDEGAHGPAKQQADGAHAHWIEVSEQNRFAYVSDLGLDRVLIYTFDAANGTLARGDAGGVDGVFSAALAPGTGPRHLAFSRDARFMYVLGEIKSTVTVFANEGGEKYRKVQTISALPDGFAARNDAAEIAMHPGGRFLYTSNRGDDSIAIFAVDARTGTLTAKGRVKTGGKEPRHFALDPAGRYLLAENQWSDTVMTFKIDTATGDLTRESGEAAVASPVCLVFARAEK